MFRIATAFTIAAVASGLSGCGMVELRHALPNAQLAEKATIPGIPYARFWGDKVPRDLGGLLRKIMPNLGPLAYRRQRASGRPLVDILALSSGGGDGAFGAGMLAGWTIRGTRPKFAVVTGVSAGALIAPFAFLGPDYDRQLHRIWTKYSAQSLLQSQAYIGLPSGPSVENSKQLTKLIARFVSQEFLNKIASEYRHGRLLLIGTTNLDAQRPVIWNMGEIAVSDDPGALALFRKVLLASASIPAIIPPVNFKVVANGQHYDELHVDGGVTRQVFLGPPALNLSELDSLYPARPIRRIYVIKNGKVVPEYTKVSPVSLIIGARSASTLIKYQTRSDIYRIYRQAKDVGARFRLATIPASYGSNNSSLFAPSNQTELFELGYDLAHSGKAWTKLPPELIRERLH